jgi:hypothetical protein
MEQISKNIKLHIQKKESFKYAHLGVKVSYNFAVCDKHIGYPKGYLCVFPVTFNKNQKGNIIFCRLFGKNYDLALSLLNQALADYESDADITEEIWRRIRLYQREKAIRGLKNG